MGTKADEIVKKNVEALNSGIFSRNAAGNQMYTWDALKVYVELEQLLPVRADEEIRELEDDIVKYKKIRDKIIVWQNGEELVVVDGHHRLRIAKKHNIRFEIERKVFTNIDAAKQWIIANQLEHRRNLNSTQSAYFIGMQYQNELKKAHVDGKNYRDMQTADNETDTEQTEKITIAERIAAKRRNMTEKTVRIYGNLFTALSWLDSKNRDVFNAIFSEAVSVNIATLEKIGSLLKSGLIGSETIKDLADFTTLANRKEEKKVPKAADKVARVLVSKLTAFYKKRTEKTKEEAIKYLSALLEGLKQEPTNK